MSVFSSIGRGLRATLSLPFLLVPWREIRAGGGAIAENGRRLLQKSGDIEVGDQQVITDQDRLVDLRSFAEQHGLSDRQARALVVRRRIETARLAYLCLGVAAVVSVFLINRLTMAISEGGPWGSTIEFIPFCAFFFLLAFKFALDNFRLRSLRHATALDYLMTNEGFWPH